MSEIGKLFSCALILALIEEKEIKTPDPTLVEIPYLML